MGQIVSSNGLEYKFKVIGYKNGNEIIDMNHRLVKVFKTLANVSYDIEDRKCFYTKGRLIRETRKLLDDIFDFHEIFMIPQKTAQNTPCLLEHRTVLEKKVRNVSVLKSPYEIPIEFSDESMTHEKLLNDLVYFYLISVDGRTTKMSIPIYIHELGHTQLDSQKGVVVDYHNNEVISIFLEKLSAFKLDDTGKLLRNVELVRYKNLLRCLKVLSTSKEDVLYKLEACVYIVSTLKADNLFGKYMYGDNKIKEKILFDIQKVFDGQQTVEELLDRYNVSLENSENDRLIRRYLRAGINNKKL